MLTELQRDTINAVVSVLETGRLPSPEAYGTASVLSDGAGITAGIHQATARSGSLQAVLQAYYALGGQIDGWTLERALGVAASSIGMSPGRESQLVRDLLALLQGAGTDPRMMAAQDQTFEVAYWRPSEMYGNALGLVLPLSYLCLYDLAIQSGPARVDSLRQLFGERPPSRGGREEAWTRALCEARARWLAASSKAIVRRSVYRVHALLDLMDTARWDLARPLTVRGLTIR
jgi:hypothetical protein